MPEETYNKDWRSPEDAGIKFKDDIIVDIQNEDRFSPENKTAYSPFNSNLFSIDNLIFLLLAKRIGKDQLASLVEKYMDNVTDLLETIVESGKTHPIAALNASTMFAVVAQRFGMITDAGYLKISDQTRSIIDKLIQIDFLNIGMDGLQTLTAATKRVRKSYKK